MTRNVLFYFYFPGLTVSVSTSTITNANLDTDIYVHNWKKNNNKINKRDVEVLQN